MTDYQTQLTQQFPNLELKLDFPIQNQTYFKLGGPAEIYLETSDQTQLATVLKFCHHQSIPVTFLGGASNTIVSDQGIAGLVISLTHNIFEVTNQEIAGKMLITVGAGLKTALMVRKSVDAGFKGLEYFLGVPGTVGGAVYNNAHYLQSLIGDHIYQVTVISAQGKIRTLSHQDCDFRYDYSVFQTTSDLIYEVTFQLEPGNKAESLQLIKEATQYRAKTQPLGEPSSGCIFQNVPNSDHLRQLFPQFEDKPFVPGGFLIDQAGLKGAAKGDIEVSHKHAAFFVNKGHGTAQDVKQLIDHVTKTVQTKFEVALQPEVFFLE